MDDHEFFEFVEQRMERWRRSAYLMCSDWHTADDIVSMTITKLYRHWRDVRKADNSDAYAQKVLTRTWLSERRRPWRRAERAAEILPDQPVGDVDRVTDRASLAALLASLGPRQRAVLILRFYFDYSAEQTADILQISVGTVKSQTARGLQALRGVPSHEFLAEGRRS
ncbi:SigE family RNA polymerase sigma factor [Actinoplanes sichuanensis]|uniref:SigE family RNA polymerase sigma factor n=1 Tax=Actinoplanes sichuanensis TaxID=512349 RepID=A0ABW4AHY2_9ACTN|nr:SigE family RNA polymerase sigma factor [Actinoplanes sichuanensis]BEL02303.1 SigE family RNA polymerase sigma factor [Actinoplanes sichuanensis]